MNNSFDMNKNGEVYEEPRFNRIKFSLFTGRTFKDYPNLLLPLLQVLKKNNLKVNYDLIHKAFLIADSKHKGQFRKSGEPYIIHPVAVASILAELGVSTETLVAALLHDTLEDTDYKIEQLRKEFGEEVALMVDGVTKLDKIVYGDYTQAETVRKMVIAMAKDIRVLVIKLADRLHNARTWKFVSPESSARKAQETLEIFAPLAHRLGMNTIKWELEDLSFAVVLPKVYLEIVNLVQDQTPEREKFLSAVSAQIQQDLKHMKLKADITARPKHYYSIYQKMVVRDKDFSDIYDLVGVRVLVDSLQDCYAVLGCIHARWNPLPGRFKDYIAMPKFNMYQSLHTTVLGPNGNAIEIQIRTYDMHRRAEYGVAAHWKYKGNVGFKKPAADNRDIINSMGEMGWLKQLVDWQKETSDPNEFLDSLRFEIGQDEIYVFTPKGEVLALPEGATPVDFAYAVHTEVGHHTIGAKVNNNLVSLSSSLKNGDLVEILTSKAENAGPSLDWKNFVKSPRARNKIKQWFSRELQEELIDEGKKILSQAITKHNLPLKSFMTHESLTEVANSLRYPDITSLYGALGKKKISSDKIIEYFVSSLKNLDEETDDYKLFGLGEKIPESRIFDVGVTVVDVEDIWTKIARCCLPAPPDKILGFVTRGSGISVHIDNCVNILKLQEDDSERIIQVRWKEKTTTSLFLVQIQVEALDRAGLFSDVSGVISASHVNILSAFLHTSKDKLAISRFVFELGDFKYLEHILHTVKQVDGVFDAYRIYGV